MCHNYTAFFVTVIYTYIINMGTNIRTKSGDRTFFVIYLLDIKIDCIFAAF